MKIRSLLALLALGGALQAHALDLLPDLTETAIVNPDYVCTRPGGMVAVNINDKRVWQAETATDTTGLELKVLRVNRFRCPHCFRIDTQLGEGPDAALMTLGLGLQGSQVKARLSPAGQEADDAASLEFDCQVRAQRR